MNADTFKGVTQETEPIWAMSHCSNVSRVAPPTLSGVSIVTKNDFFSGIKPVDGFQFGLLYLNWVNVQADYTAKAPIRGK